MGYPHSHQLLHVVVLVLCVLLCVSSSDAIRLDAASGRREEMQQQSLQTSAAPSSNKTSSNGGLTPSLEQEQVDGYEVIRHVIERLHTNLQGEVRALTAIRMVNSKQCKASIRKLKLKIAKKQARLGASLQTLRLNKRRYRVAQARLNKLRPMIKKKKRQLSAVAKSIKAGDQRLKEQLEIAKNKTKDANTVLNASNALFAMLTASAKSAGKKAPVARFREEMTNVQAKVSDASVMRFLEGTLQSLETVKDTAKPKGATAPNKEDMTKLRLLLSLVRSQLKQFAQTVKGDSKSAKELWSLSRAQLKSQAVLIKRELLALLKDAKKARKVMRITGKTIRIEVAVQRGAGPKSLKLMKTYLATIVADCTQRNADNAGVAASHKAALKLVAGLSRIPFSKDDDVVLDRVAVGIKVPKLNKVDSTGKRCCKLCDRAKGYKPCGNKCIRDEETCTSALGCACESPTQTEQN